MKNIQSKKLTLSIVIPAHNEEDHIQECLQSIVTQTVPPDEVIVVDNNCTDQTIQIASQYSFVRIVKERRQGIAPARDAGFNAVHSELIARIDADTVLPADWVERVLDIYAERDDFILTGGGYFYNVPLPRLNGWLQGQFAYRVNRFIMGHYITWGSNMVVPAKIWQRLNHHVCTTRNDIHEDLDLAIHAHRLGIPITYIENLRVGVEMKRVYNTVSRVHKARMAMWPATLYAHGLKRAWLGSVGAWVLYQGRFVVRFANFLTQTYRRGRMHLEAEWEA